MEDLKQEVMSHFTNMQEIMLATAEGDKPRLRPVTLLRHEDRFWILTGTNDAKTQQLRANPSIEFALMLEKGENRRGEGQL